MISYFPMVRLGWRTALGSPGKELVGGVGSAGAGTGAAGGVAEFAGPTGGTALTAGGVAGSCNLSRTGWAAASGTGQGGTTKAFRHFLQDSRLPGG